VLFSSSKFRELDIHKSVAELFAKMNR
jgi:hypothetical protein